MGCDYYIETHIVIIFKDAAKNHEKILLSTLYSSLDDLFDTQILSKKIIYKDNNWLGNYNEIQQNINIDINDVERIEKIISVKERF